VSYWRRATARLGARTGSARDAVAAAILAGTLATWLVLASLLVHARQPKATPLSPLLLTAATLLTVAGCAAIGARRRLPRTALALATALVLVCAALSVTTVGPGIGIVVCAYTLASLASWRTVAPALAGCAAAHCLGALVITQAGGRVSGPTFWGVPGTSLRALAFATLASYGIPALLGASVRGRRAATTELVDRADRLEAERLERDRLAAAEERTRIARELHDIAAHDLSAIVVQAGAADRLVDTDPAAVKSTLYDIRRQGRETLTALRQLVGVMREDDGGGRSPQPTLARLSELVSSARAAGMSLDVVTCGPPEHLPAASDVAAYRVVQESLTNARQHAPGAAVMLSVTHDHGLTLVVRNGPTSNGPPAAASGDWPGAGHGLVGMRERVQQAGGTLVAGPTPDHGWQVTVRLPQRP